MAILSKFNRYEGPTVRMIGFSGDKYILDNRVLDRDRISINKNVIDIPGNKEELTAGSFFCNNFKTTVQGYTHQYFTKPLLMDISSWNSAFGLPSWSDPVDEDENYIISYYNGGKAANVLTKVDRNGNILLQSQLSSAYTSIIDANEKYIITLSIHTDYTNYIIAYDRKTLEQVYYISTGVTYVLESQVLYRDNINLCVFDPFSGTPKYHDKTNESSRVFVVMNKTRDDQKALQTYSYSNHALTNFTVPMKNGWSFKPITLSSEVSKPFQFEAIKIDGSMLTYDTCAKDEIQVTYAESIDEKLKNLTYLDSNYNYYNAFICHKVTDTIFIMFQMIDFHSKTSLGTTVKPRYYVCRTDETDPKRIEIVTAKEFDFVYLERPMVYDKNKFMFIQEDVASHMYKFNEQTNDLTLTWNISTPNIVSACCYNGIYWWVNKSTSALNYEIETNTLEIKDSYEFDEVTLENPETPGSNTYKISIYNSDKQRVVKNVKLECQGPITFDNDSKEKVVSTSADNDLSLALKVINAGESFIKVTIVE